MDELVFEKELNEIFKLDENERNKKYAELKARANKLSEKVIQKKIKEEKEINLKKIEIAKKIVTSGKSTIFNNWHEKTGIEEKEFLNGLKWLYEEPFDNYGNMTRELQIDKTGKLHYLKRLTDHDTGIVSFSENGFAAQRTDTEEDEEWREIPVDRPSINCRDRI